MKAVVTCLTFFCFCCFAGFKETPLYKNGKAPVDKRVEDLLKRMTLEEKIWQLNQYTLGSSNNPNNVDSSLKQLRPETGSLIFFSSDPEVRNKMQRRAMNETRLGIPVLFGYDVIHGYRTVYPIPLAQACSWNTSLVAAAGRIAASEARSSGIDWTFSPMIDIGRDPRWGRVAEGYGEDTYANAVFGAATVKAYQGDTLSDQRSVAACLKHYVAYGLSEGGRDYHYSDVSPQSLWETYLPPYEAGVKAGAATVMSAFNDISGIPATANHYTLTEILKNKWGFKGFVVSDWKAVQQMIAQGVAADRKEAGRQAFLAGVHMDMVDNIYQEYLAQLVREKKISLSLIDDAVRRILRLKFELGLFEQPYTPVTDEANRYLQSSKRIASELAGESIVLLRNRNNVLPFTKIPKKIAVIGPMAKNREHLLGSWSAHGRPADVETIFEGLENEFNSTSDLLYAQGCDFDGDNTAGFTDALKTAAGADAVIVCLGEKKSWSGENASRSSIALPQVQEELIAELSKAGKPIILVLSNGRPLELVRIEKFADAIIELWQPGIAGGSALAGIISGQVNPSGKLAITFPLTTGQVPVYYNMRQSARPQQGKYQDIPTEPLYKFGHGLSYTTFTYSDIRLSAARIRKTEKLIAEVDVTNTGSMDGKETVLWFASDPVASVSRPMKELKYFEKKWVATGTKVTYRFEIDPRRDLSFPDATGKKRLEAGEFFILAGDKKIRFELVD